MGVTQGISQLSVLSVLNVLGLCTHTCVVHAGPAAWETWMVAARAKLTSHVPLVKLSWSIPLWLGCGRVLPLAEVGVSPLGLCFM